MSFTGELSGGTETGRLVARLRAAGCVFAEDEAALLLTEAGSPGELEHLVGRRVAGEPLEHLLGWAQFGDLRVCVRPGVFVPRARSLTLVDGALAVMRPGDVVLDLCCGTGAIGAVLQHTVPSAQVYAADIDERAAACARENLSTAGGDPGRVYVGDLYAPLPGELRGRVAVLVVNAPYVPTDEIAFMPVEAREHEDRVALDGGPDGSALHRRSVAGAGDWLAPGGVLLIETGRRQASLVAALMDGAGLAARVVHDDDRDGTVVQGVRPAPSVGSGGGVSPGN